MLKRKLKRIQESLLSCVLDRTMKFLLCFNTWLMPMSYFVKMQRACTFCWEGEAIMILRWRLKDGTIRSTAQRFHKQLARGAILESSVEVSELKSALSEEGGKSEKS